MPNEPKENTTEQLQELFGGSFDSNQVITTKKSGATTKLDELRADILKDRQSQMKAHGNNIRFGEVKGYLITYTAPERQIIDLFDLEDYATTGI